MHGNARKGGSRTAGRVCYNRNQEVKIITSKTCRRLLKRLICKSRAGIHSIMEEDEDEKMCEMRHRSHR